MIHLGDLVERKMCLVAKVHVMLATVIATVDSSCMNNDATKVQLNLPFLMAMHKLLSSARKLTKQRIMWMRDDPRAQKKAVMLLMFYY